MTFSVGGLDTAELRKLFQRHFFQSDVEQEQVFSVVPVIRTNDRKKKQRFLCLTIKNDSPLIYVINEEKGGLRKKPELYYISKLKEIDGRSRPNDRNVLDFILTFSDNKVGYAWTAARIREKNEFIVSISRLYRKYGLGADKTQLRFVNLDEVLEDELAREGIENCERERKEKVVYQSSSQMSTEEKEEAMVLSAKDQEELQKVLELSRQFDHDPDRFLNSLTTEILQTETANVHDLMNTQRNMDNVCRFIDESLESLNKMDVRIAKYYGLIGNVTGQVTMMDETGYKLKVKKSNIQKLIDDISTTLDTLEFSTTRRAVIMDGNIMDPKRLPEIMEAADALSHILRTKLPQGMEYHPAVVKQKKTLDNLRKAFGERVASNLSNNFTSYSNSRSASVDNEYSLPDHSDWFRSVDMYIPVIKWIKENIQDPPVYQNLVNDYVNKIGDLCNRELAEYFGKVKTRFVMIGDGGDGRRNLEYWIGCEEEMSISNGDLMLYRSHLDYLKQAFQEIARYVVHEQRFLIDFFNLPPENGLVVNSTIIPDACEFGSTYQNSTKSSVYNSQTSTSKSESQLRFVLKGLFRNMDDMLAALALAADKTNKMVSLGLLVSIHDILVQVEPDCPFMSKSYGGMLIMVKRNFDTYIRDQIQSVLTAKIPRKLRIGPLPFVCNFEHFAKIAEHVFEGSPRRGDLDRAFINLLKQGIFEGIHRVAYHKDCKVPPEVVFLENYHRLSDILSRLKIPSLEEIRKEIKQAHYDYRKSYVQGMLGKPLDKVQAFFDGVDAKIQTAGIQPHEIAFTAQFNKAELKKVLALYPKSVVKRALEQLYKRVEKQLSDEEHLLEAIWHDMQREFIEQYQNYVRIIEVCYPGSQIKFEFDIDDILKIFVDIAASH